MSIEKLTKITLYGLTKDKQLILRELQKIGCIHLIPLAKTENTVLHKEVDTVEFAKEARAYLLNCPNKRRTIYKTEKPIKLLIQEVLENKRKLRALSDKKDKLTQRINVLRPWGDFKFLPLEQIQNLRLWFYQIPLREIKIINFSKLNYQIVYSNNKTCYVVIVSEQEPDTSTIHVKRSHVGYISLSELEAEKEQTEQEIDECKFEREHLTRWFYLINKTINHFEDIKTLYDACDSTLNDNNIFAISGWLPCSREKQFIKLINEQKIAATIEEPTKDDKPPSLINRNQILGGGSDTMLFFMTPNYKAWDAGTVLFFSFCLFFGMIMNDAVYSLLFGLIIGMFHKKMSKSQKGSRLRNMFYFMSLAGILWGMLAGSYFGVEPESGFLKSIHIIDMSNYTKMMKLSVIIGAIHIVLANLIVAFNLRKKLHSLSRIGWCFVITGGLLLWLGYTGDLNDNYKTVLGPTFGILGAVFILFFESHRPINNFKNIIMRLLDGINGLWHITGAFGDVLSYMRLFALGLAGAALAMTFNKMAVNVYNSSHIGVIFSFFILLIGHILNLALSLMAAFVHGIRLNVIEFFKWALSEEGYPFKPFKKTEE